jgi:hypothetical protein
VPDQASRGRLGKAPDLAGPPLPQRRWPEVTLIVPMRGHSAGSREGGKLLKNPQAGGPNIALSRFAANRHHSDPHSESQRSSGVGTSTGLHLMSERELAAEASPSLRVNPSNSAEGRALVRACPA